MEHPNDHENAGQSKIQHKQPGFGDQPPSADSVAMPETPGGSVVGSNKIRAIGEKGPRHEDAWSRTPNTTGEGAIHVKSFHCKLTDDALHYMDQMINEWLDAHPQYEVKFATTSVGLLTGKLKEPHLICQVWV